MNLEVADELEALNAIYDACLHVSIDETQCNTKPSIKVPLLTSILCIQYI